MNFKDIEKVNSEILLIDIKGTAYADVSQRVQAFRKLYPEGFITTEIVTLSEGICVIKAEAGYYGPNNVKVTLGTGTAYEKEGSGFINKTSYIENCETSAVGRALGMLGIGIDGAIASANETLNATIQQEAMSKITPVMLKAVRASIENNDLKEDKLLEYFGIKSLEDMNVLQMRQFNDMVEKSKAESKKEKK